MNYVFSLHFQAVLQVQLALQVDIFPPNTYLSNIHVNNWADWMVLIVLKPQPLREKTYFCPVSCNTYTPSISNTLIKLHWSVPETFLMVWSTLHFCQTVTRWTQNHHLFGLGIQTETNVCTVLTFSTVTMFSWDFIKILTSYWLRNGNVCIGYTTRIRNSAKLF